MTGTFSDVERATQKGIQVIKSQITELEIRRKNVVTSLEKAEKDLAAKKDELLRVTEEVRRLSEKIKAADEKIDQNRKNVQMSLDATAKRLNEKADFLKAEETRIQKLLNKQTSERGAIEASIHTFLATMEKARVLIGSAKDEAVKEVSEFLPKE